MYINKDYLITFLLIFNFYKIWYKCISTVGFIKIIFYKELLSDVIILKVTPVYLDTNPMFELNFL